MTPEKLIEQLRAEVRDVKDCFTQFAFQSAALATVAAGFILSTLESNPWVAFAGVPIIMVLLLVCRVGIFKYSTANRNLGYQLHLERLAAYRKSQGAQLVCQ